MKMVKASDMSEKIVSKIDSNALKELCANIAAVSRQQKSWTVNDWPEAQLKLIADAGVYRWFVSEELGGFGWTADDIARGYIELGAACLTSTFIVTQRVAALKRIASSAHSSLVERVLPEMLDGTKPGTVGISHLTTSRRHVKQPVLSVQPAGEDMIANGMAPWVTGGSGADSLLLGGVLEGGEEVLFLVPTSAQGISIEPGFDLVALSASHTGVVKCDDVRVSPEMIVAGPKESVLSSGKGGGAGSVQTSALALGLAKSAIDFIERESKKRPDLKSSCDSLQQQFDLIAEETFAVAAGEKEHTGELRADANSLDMRSTQAAMIAAKGAGFVDGHPVGRWCCEALFFLVWSCPQSVAEANLCGLVEVGS